MVKKKVFTVGMRERRARGIWKSPQQRESRGLNMVWAWPGEKQEQRRKGVGREREAKTPWAKEKTKRA